MLKFVIGVDKRSGRFGAELERLLTCTYDIVEFQIVGLQCNLKLNSIRAHAMQVDCMWSELRHFDARFYLGLSSGRVLLPSPVGQVPTLVTVMTAIDRYGLVWFDCIEPVGFYLPLHLRGYTTLPRTPDLLDIVRLVVEELAGTETEPLSSSA